MNGILIAAAAVALSTSATAKIHPVRFEGDTAHIDFGDLDLASHHGRAQLIGRIRRAAERLCANYDGSVLSFARTNQCDRVLMASGIEQIDKIASAKSRYASEPRAITGSSTAPLPAEYLP